MPAYNQSIEFMSVLDGIVNGLLTPCTHK